MTEGSSLLGAFAESGFAVVEGAVPPEELRLALAEASRLAAPGRQRGGIRGVLAKSLVLRRLADEGAPARIARAVIGSAARPVKGTLFDKTPASNWKVPWHQDLSIAVEARCDMEGFGPWSVKDGVVHVQPPAGVLEKVLAIRVHFDPAGSDNGALRVIPGSHLFGRLSEAEVDRLVASEPHVEVPVPAGGLMLMAPLLLHASSASTSPHHRRVLHIEYAAISLPGSLKWAGN